jgi:hypothetical protein
MLIAVKADCSAAESAPNVRAELLKDTSCTLLPLIGAASGAPKPKPEYGAGAGAVVLLPKRPPAEGACAPQEPKAPCAAGAGAPNRLPKPLPDAAGAPNALVEGAAAAVLPKRPLLP